MAQRQYKYVIFGASGYTGQYTVEHLAKYLADKPDVKWAVAGRNESKIVTYMQQASENCGIELKSIPILYADVNDEPSLVKMAQSTEIVIDVVGPYTMYGEPVVKACAENGCSFVDISGEKHYVESMQDKYDEVARANNCFIVSMCGYECIPEEMFTEHLLANNPDVKAVQIFTEVVPGPNGYRCNHGTYDSAIVEFSNFELNSPILKRIMPVTLPKPANIFTRSPVFKTSGLSPGINDKWVVAMPDLGVNLRTQYYKYVSDNQQPMQFTNYFVIGSFIHTCMVIVWMMNALILSKIPFMRRLLHKYPELFSFGVFTKDGPTRKQADTSGTRVWVVGHTGNSAPKIMRFDTPDLAYNAASIFIVSSAATIVEERDKLPKKGGVYTPGIAFRNTNIIEKIGNMGIKIEHIQ